MNIQDIFYLVVFGIVCFLFGFYKGRGLIEDSQDNRKGKYSNVKNTTFQFLA